MKKPIPISLLIEIGRNLSDILVANPRIKCEKALQKLPESQQIALRKAVSDNVWSSEYLTEEAHRILNINSADHPTEKTPGQSAHSSVLKRLKREVLSNFLTTLASGRVGRQTERGYRT